MPFTSSKPASPLADDTTILAGAETDDRVVVSSDTDFGALLARHNRSSPSFVLIRHMNELTPDGQADLLIAAIGEAEPEIEAGAVVSIARGRIRVREAPIRALGAGLRTG